MPIGLKTCGCCNNIVPCSQSSSAYAERNGTSRLMVGDESVASAKDGATAFGDTQQFSSPVRIGEEHKTDGITHNYPPAFRIPPSTFTHFRQTGDLTFSVDVGARQYSHDGINPLSLIGQSVPVANLRSFQVMTNDGSSWAAVGSVVPDGSKIGYTHNLTFTNVTLTDSIDIDIGSLRGQLIGFDVGFEFATWNGTTTGLHTRNVGLAPVSWWGLSDGNAPPSVSRSFDLSMNQVSMSGVEFCPKLDINRHTWQIVKSNTPPASIRTSWHSPVFDHAFDTLGTCDATHDRYQAGPQQIPVERWSISWGKLWPELIHVLLRDDRWYDAAWYRPDGWNGVEAKSWLLHSTEGKKVEGAFPDYIGTLNALSVQEPSQRTVTANLGDSNDSAYLHPDAFTVSLAFA